MTEYTTILPSAGRLMVSLRDIGYDCQAPSQILSTTPLTRTRDASRST